MDLSNCKECNQYNCLIKKVVFEAEIQHKKWWEKVQKLQEKQDYYEKKFNELCILGCKLEKGLSKYQLSTMEICAKECSSIGREIIVLIEEY